MDGGADVHVGTVRVLDDKRRHPAVMVMDGPDGWAEYGILVAELMFSFCTEDGSCGDGDRATAALRSRTSTWGCLN